MTRNVLPVDVSDVTGAVLALLKADTRLEGVTIDRSEAISEDPGLKGWVGVYRQRIEYPSRTLGAGSGYRQTRVHLVLAIRYGHPGSGEQCELGLEKLVQTVASVVLSDEALGGTVDTLDDIEVQYPDYKMTKGGQYTQLALLFVVGVTNVNVEFT